MRNPSLPLGLSALLLFASNSVPAFGQEQNPPTAPNASLQASPPAANDTAKTMPPGQFILQDGTPVKLRINRNVSSADATVGEQVDFEVLEEVTVQGVVVVPKGGTAIASVTEAQPKRRMARGGKLEIVLDYVRLADTEKAAVRAVKDVKGGGHTGGMTAGIVATGLLFWPAAPFFLFMHGKDITVPKGAEVTAYVNGDLRLDQSKFSTKIDAAPTSQTPSLSAQPTTVNAQVPTQTPVENGRVEVSSAPDGAEVYVDGSFVGNAPATLKLSPGQHTVRVTHSGFKDWSRDLTVQSGSNVHLAAALEQ